MPFLLALAFLGLTSWLAFRVSAFLGSTALESRREPEPRTQKLPILRILHPLSQELPEHVVGR